jgi:hypothetical protein
MFVERSLLGSCCYVGRSTLVDDAPDHFRLSGFSNRVTPSFCLILPQHLTFHIDLSLTLLSTMPHNYVAPKFPPRRAPMIPESDSDDSSIGVSQTPPTKRARTLSSKAKENTRSTYILSERQCVETGDQWWEGVSLYRYSPKLGRSNRDRLLQMDPRCDLR